MIATTNFVLHFKFGENLSQTHIDFVGVFVGDFLSFAHLKIEFMGAVAHTHTFVT